MKHYLKSLATVVATSLVLLSCADEKESALNISDIRGNATVEGKIEYDAGANTQTGQNALNPAANRKLYFYLELSSLESSSENPYDGRLTYTTTTSSDGTFSIKLPANAKGIDYAMSMESFEAVRWVYDSNAGDPPYSQKNYFFTNTNLATFTLYENINLYEYRVCRNYEEIK